MGFIYCIKSNVQGNLPKTDFLTSWLRQQSDMCMYIIIFLCSRSIYKVPSDSKTQPFKEGFIIEDSVSSEVKVAVSTRRLFRADLIRFG